jgi:Carboxypeptidase regulatory-like domain
MSATARESKTRFPLLACWPFRLDVGLRKVLTNVLPTARPSRAKRESPISCVLRSPVFLLAQPGGFFLFRRFGPLLRARLGQTYATSEWVCCALRILRNLLRTTPQNLSTQMVSRSAAATTLFFCLALFPWFCSAAPAPSQQGLDDPSGQTNVPASPEPSLPCGAKSEEKRYGTISGRLVDQNGNGVAGTSVQIRSEQESATQEVQSGQDGRFAFDRVAAGPFQLTATGEGFVPQTISNTLQPGEDYVVSPITMYLATVVTEVRVSPPTKEIAQEEFKDLEQQRVLGIVPNYYVSYIGEAAPLTRKRKFELALKATTDPVTTVAVATIAGVGQATNRFSGYGQGAQGYAKRYGASYANLASGLWIGGAVLPSILKQDPRYFYKGTGTKRSRFLYAVSRPFICKGDNQRWQPNYSSVFGDLAAGGLSNLYIPQRDRHGAALTFENAGIALGTSAVINVLQEFVLHRITSKRE